MSFSRALLLALFTTWVAPTFAAEPVRHTVLIMAKSAGVQTSMLGADGVREVSFEFNDRGRGPKLTTRVRLDARSVPIAVETQGNDYLKAPVAERFSLENGLARWKNDAESGEQRFASAAFYVSLQSVPLELGWLAKALLAAPAGQLPLLPEGHASIKSVGEQTVQRDGVAQRVRAYQISGLDFTPMTVWLDESDELFASLSSWMSVIREGWESSVQPLLDAQDAVDATRSREVARTLTRKPAAALAITNARVFDDATGRLVPGSTVLIEGQRIKAVGPAARVVVPASAERIDAAGKAVLPGLWDMHVHLGPDEGVLHLAAGVTSVRDLANDNDALLAIRRKIDAGEEIGPRITMRGFMDGRGPYAGPTKVFVDTVEEGRAAIDNYAKLGYEGIKIYSSIKPELVPPLIQMAHERGLRLSGHVPAFMTAQQFVEAGADELQHLNFIFLNFFFDEVKDTRTPARFTALAERAGTLDLNAPPVRAFIKLLKERNVVVDPTVAIFVGMLTDRPGTMSSTFAPIAARLPPQVRRSLLGGGLPVPEGKDAAYRASAQALLRMVKVLYDAGITIVPGTDNLAGFTLHRELELYAQAGIPNADVLRIATSVAARVAKRDAEVGTVAAGKLADLILVDGDPLQRISDIRRTTLVIKDGNVYEPAALYGSVGVKAE